MLTVGVETITVNVSEIKAKKKKNNASQPRPKQEVAIAGVELWRLLLSHLKARGRDLAAEPRSDPIWSDLLHEISNKKKKQPYGGSCGGCNK